MNVREEGEESCVTGIERGRNLGVPLLQPRSLARARDQRRVHASWEAHLVPEEVGGDPVRGNFGRVAIVRRQL